MSRKEQTQEAAIKYVEQGFPDTFIAGFLYGAMWADSHPQWIPVEERLPKEGQVVLIHTKGNGVSTACYTDGRFDITELLEAINVTHWMPIVPPRKEE